jgi:prepilin-type N-terminal cleavage/methylation domain-containing protein
VAYRVLILIVVKTTASSGCAGFTLPEMVISALIMAVGLSIFATTLTMSSRAIYTAKLQMNAVNFARQELENKRQYAYGDPQLNVGTTAISNSLYTGQMIVSYVGSSTSRLKQVSARINWKNLAGNVTTSAVLTTVICNSMH